ncbi:MAG: hypothetical protein K1X39_09065 [Thermoflexales bacterium]|nr:hypothetical protein [Thermoflexales bacterium]
MTTLAERFQDAARALEALDVPGHTAAYAFESGIPRARLMLERLGGGSRIVKRCVLVTGSKGKGSTVMLIANALAAAGYRVGAYTGPHLISPTERFRLADARGALADMPPEVFIDYARACCEIAAAWDRPELGHPTRFEAYTAMAYHWFEREHADIGVMEIGIGGRLDAVNLADPLVSVIVNVSLEHTAALGDTVTAIATEKAGILRADGIGISAAQSEEGERALCAAAAAIGAPLRFAEARWHCTPGEVFIAPGETRQTFTARPWRTPLAIPLLGAYQLQNAAAALAALEALKQKGFTRLSARAIRAGFARARWPARFEVLHHEPLVIADGAHTPYSMEQLGQSLRAYFPHRRLHVVVGMLRDKDGLNMLRALAGFADSVTLTEPAYHRATPLDRLREMWAQVAGERLASAQLPPVDAIRTAISSAAVDDVVVVTGSLHLATEAARALATA